MTKHDRFKEEIGWLKALGALFATGLTSVLVWLVQNYGTANRVTVSWAGLTLSCFVAVIAAIILRLYRCLKILEAL